MKNLFICLFTCLIIGSCKTQDAAFVAQDVDIIVINTENIGKWKYINFAKLESYSSEEIFVLLQPQPRLIPSLGMSEKLLIFSERSDTMYIKCKCIGKNNYYFTGLKFKKGLYELSFEFPKEKMTGSQIKTSNDVQSILFKNSFIEATGGSNTSCKDIYFKDLKFYEINLKDTTKVKLIEIKSQDNL